MFKSKLLLLSLATLLMFANGTIASAQNTCITHRNLVQQVLEKAQADKNQQPEFRINKADDGQSLIYWHTGGETGSFFAASFKPDGCAILTAMGELRRFTFPKTAFNTGVFFEMDKLDIRF